MISVLIPFFLTTQLAVDDSVWQHGPQYKFNVSAFIEIEHIGTNLYSGNVTNQLICRTKDLDTLSCHMNAYKSVLKETDLLTNESQISQDDYDDYDGIKIVGTTFEIKFDKKGAHSVITPANWTELDDTNQKIVKIIADSLSIGIDLSGKDDGKFEETDTFVLGECVTNFNLEHVPSSDENRAESGNYVINLLDKTEKSGNDVHLTKVRDYENCSSRYKYSFITLFLIKDGKSAAFNATSSTHEMHITDTAFSSSFHTMAIGPHNRYNRTIKFSETYLLTLDSIEPAEGELTKVHNPVSSLIFDPADVQKDLENN